MHMPHQGKLVRFVCVEIGYLLPLCPICHFGKGVVLSGQRLMEGSYWKFFWLYGHSPVPLSLLYLAWGWGMGVGLFYTCLPKPLPPWIGPYLCTRPLTTHLAFIKRLLVRECFWWFICLATYWDSFDSSVEQDSATTSDGTDDFYCLNGLEFGHSVVSAQTALVVFSTWGTLLSDKTVLAVFLPDLIQSVFLGRQLCSTWIESDIAAAVIGVKRQCHVRQQCRPVAWQVAVQGTLAVLCCFPTLLLSLFVLKSTIVFNYSGNSAVCHLIFGS